MSAAGRNGTPGQPWPEVLPESLGWQGRPSIEYLAPLPGCPAVVLFLDQDRRPVQLLTTQQLKRLAISRLTNQNRPPAGRADLAAVVRALRWRRIYCPFEGRWWYYRLARVLYPDDYRKRIGFGPAWFLWLDRRRSVPELRVTERIWTLPGDFVGPWPAQKACRAALDGLIDLFDLCREPQQVRRAPAGQRCSYADMGRCDAPCDGSVPLDAYVDRACAAWRFAGGGVADWIAQADRHMQEAAARQHYERAALLKEQIAFARRWTDRWADAVCTADQMTCLLVIPATRRKACKLFLFRRGHLIDGPLLPLVRLIPATRSWAAQTLSEPLPDLDPQVRMEQTWLVAHFLQHRESQSALIERLPTECLPPDLEEHLHAALAQPAARPDSMPP